MPPAPDATVRAPPPIAADRLPMVATVGFVGHRRFDDEAAARAAIEAAFVEIGRAFALVSQGPLAEAFDGADRLRLLIGAAPGADRLAAAAWREAGLGEVHLIFPFRDPGADAAWTDRPERGDLETRVEPEGAWTGIDSASLGLAGDQAHAEVARWIVRHADVLVAWWDGEPSRGAGGTADTVERTLARGLPVVWLQPGRLDVRLADPARALRHADAAEALTDMAALAQPLTAEALASLLATALGPPGDPAANDPDVAARRDYARIDPLAPRWPALAPLQRLLDHTLWTAFRRFETLAGGRPPRDDPAPPPPAALVSQPGFARLSAAGVEADARADHLGAIHRSEQLWLILLAIAAVVVGASPSVAEPGAPQSAAHLWAAALELALGAMALGVTWAARRAHRHRRWSDARALAERLRGARATWPLGVDIADTQVGPAQTWTEWRARAVLRAAGPRQGWFDGAAFREAAQWGAAQLLDSQIAYHARLHRVAERIETNIGLTEGLAFAVLMLTLAVYLAALATAPITGWRPTHQVGGFVTMVSAVTPAIGGGCLALAATNGFAEMARRSARMAAAFRQLRDELGESGAYHHVQGVLRRGAQLLADDADAWRDRLQRRRLVRGA